MDLLELFEALNQRYFEGKLEAPKLFWNTRLRASAGRFVPGNRSFLWRRPPSIEIATYLKDEKESLDLIQNTMGHEMIHYWLWVQKKPYGHTPSFKKKMIEMGVSRYNPVPKLRPYRYIYACPQCRKDFKVRKKLKLLACADCCKQHSGGKFDHRFKLFLSAELPE